MQVAEAKDVDQRAGRNRSGEDEPGEVVIFLREDVLTKRLVPDVFLVAAVADPIAADDDEDDIRILLVDPLRRLHEDIKPAHRLEAPANVGDDAGRWEE